MKLLESCFEGKSLRGCKVIPNTVQNMNFSIKDFYSKFGPIHRKLRIWSHLLKKSSLEIFCTVKVRACRNSNITTNKIETPKFSPIIQDTTCKFYQDAISDSSSMKVVLLFPISKSTQVMT